MLNTILRPVKKYSAIVYLFSLLFLSALNVVYAGDGLPPTGLSSIEGQIKTQTSSVKAIVGHIIEAVLVISLIWVIWAVATSSPTARAAVVSFVAAIIVWIIAFQIL
jgi:hypothetical protein